MTADKLDERKVATDLERGSGASLAQLLHGKFEEDRVKSLHTIEKYYKQDLADHHKFNVDLEFNTSDFWHNEISVVDNNSGKSLYTDSLDLKQLTHTETDMTLTPAGKEGQLNNRTYAATSDRQPVDAATVASVTQDLEAGKPDSLTAALSGKMQEERVRFLDAVQAKNQEDLQHKRTNYGLDVTVEGFKYFTNQLSVMREAPGSIFTANFWSNPSSIYTDTLDMRTDKRQIWTRVDERK